MRRYCYGRRITTNTRIAVDGGTSDGGQKLKRLKAEVTRFTLRLRSMSYGGQRGYEERRVGDPPYTSGEDDGLRVLEARLRRRVTRSRSAFVDELRRAGVATRETNYAGTRSTRGA